MSDDSQTIVDLDVGPDDAGRLAEAVRAWLVARDIIRPRPSDCVLGGGLGHEPGAGYGAAVVRGTPDDGLLRLATNGLAFWVGRRAFDPGSNGTELACGACGAVFEPDPGWPEVVGAWLEGDDGATFPCPACARPQRLPDWRGPWPWGFGHLGLEFWNWPPLSDEFVRAVGEQLGHRTILVRCHL